MKNLKIIFIQSFSLLFSKKILYTTIFSFLLSTILLGILISCFWNFLPTLNWAKALFFGLYNYLFNQFWIFIISSTFIYLFPPVSTIISGFFLERVVDYVNIGLGSNKEFKLDGDGFLGGIIVGVRILGYSTIIFILILIFKWFVFSSIFFSILIQFIASSFIIGKEYYEIVALKYFDVVDSKRFKRRNFINIYIIGMCCNLIFLIPILNLIAPILCTIMMTLRFNQLKFNV